MTNNDKLAKLLPEGLSDEGIEAINTLVKETVEERVDSEMSNLNAKVSGYLRLKLDELKAQALKELEASDEVYRAVKVYESLKSIVAEDIESSDTNSTVSMYKEENETLQSKVDELNNKLASTMNENSTLEGAVTTLREDITSLSEIQKKPFKSSEKALVITNERKNEGIISNSADNSFLTEDVIRLSNSLQK
tara:strand:+ start:1890 stop:2468 length:579 start_codon:yes stop_codon:yes gene_type:complete